jgi:RNA polymerase sigma factor (sigma-70 family)
MPKFLGDLAEKLWLAHLLHVRRVAGRRSAWVRFRKDRDVGAYMPVVAKLAREAKRKLHQHLDLEDLTQAGMVGLAEAIQRYDPASGAFAAFAYWRVRGAIYDAHKRRAYREEQNLSLDEIRSPTGWLPGDMERDHCQPVDIILIRQQLLVRIQLATEELSPDGQWIVAGLRAGKSLAGLARESGRSEGWVREQWNEAKAVMRNSLRGAY